MTRRLPLLPTIIVLAAFGTMVGLGVWQLQRLQWKENLLARYEAAQADGTEVPWPAHDDQVEPALYHRSSVDCAIVHSLTERAGRNSKGEAGLAIYADCETESGARVDVVLGWRRELPSFDPATIGKVEGIIAPGPRLVADPPQLGLEANARPDPNDIPNNHLSYAIQWFFFAITALVIYALALRKRWNSEGDV